MKNLNCMIISVEHINGSRSVAGFSKYLCFFFFLLLSLNLVKAQSSDVSIENVLFKSNSVSLAGTLYTPRYPHAAVVLVHGSGQAPRMSEFALHLAENGITVLTYDKRGVGESGGIYAGPEVGTNNVSADNLILLAKDANAAVKVLHQRDKNVPIGLAGISQAGWIIPIAATLNPLVDFMVLFSGSVIPTLEQLRFQFFTNGKTDFWDHHTESEVRERISSDADDGHYFSDADRYQFVNTDPVDALSRLSIPGLWLFGAKDVQVPVGLSIEPLNTLKAQGKPYEYCLFSTLGHNVAFSKSTEPVDIAIHWIKSRNHHLKSGGK